MKNKKIIIIAVTSLLIILAVGTFYAVSKSNNSNSEAERNASKTCTTFGNSVQEQCIEDYIGLSQKEADDRARRYDYIPQIVSIDGVEQSSYDIVGPNIYLEFKNGSVVRGYFREKRDGAPKTCTTYGDRVEEQCIEDYIGLSEQEATDRAKRYRYNPQIVSVDGVGQAVNDIGGPNIRLTVKNGSVSGGYFPE